MEKGENPDTNDLKIEIKLHIRGAVSNYKNNEYDDYYPINGSDMMFGAQSIDVGDGLHLYSEKKVSTVSTLSQSAHDK